LITHAELPDELLKDDAEKKSAKSDDKAEPKTASQQT
jgi:hypothetical protein